MVAWWGEGLWELEAGLASGTSRGGRPASHVSVAGEAGTGPAGRLAHAFVWRGLPSPG